VSSAISDNAATDLAGLNGCLTLTPLDLRSGQQPYLRAHGSGACSFGCAPVKSAGPNPG
jgi:hypothetical protein